MIKSMTGYGKASGLVANVNTSIELRSLNSKSVDLSIRFPSSYKPYEIDFRNQITDILKRGKIELNISKEEESDATYNTLNTKLIKHYYEEFSKLEKEIGTDINDKLSHILSLPDVFSSTKVEANENEATQLKKILDEALKKLDQYRMQEGVLLEKDFRTNVANIASLLSEIPHYAAARIEKIKERIRKNINAHLDDIAVDQNRFEQELIYYIEKIDVNEEISRLQGHLDYFIECMDSDTSEGKKLRFISQEMGREINTLGAKSYDMDMQKIVVIMKDELEKIKEQLLNVL